MPLYVPNQKFEMAGIHKLLGNLNPASGAVWTRAIEAASRAMVENSEDLLGRAQRDAPVDEGTLRASGSAEITADGRLVAMIGFKRTGEGTDALEQITKTGAGGGYVIEGRISFNTVYALAQHERLDYAHPKGGKAKYLEDNLTNQTTAYLKNMENHLRRAVG
jgi:hypothetical protein